MKPNSNQRAFTLVELLVVVAIVLILAALAVPAFNSIGQSQALTAGLNTVVDNLKSARQMALAQNRVVNVRFYKIPGEAGGDPAYRALKVFKLDESGVQPDAVSKLQRFSGNVVISDDVQFTTIPDAIDTNGAIATEDLPGAPAVPYKSVSFTPSGATTLGPNSLWFLSLKSENAAPVSGKPAINFATVQIDPINGAVKVFRP